MGPVTRTVGILASSRLNKALAVNGAGHPADKYFPFDKNVTKKVGKARACGSQRRAAGVPKAIGTLLYCSARSQLPAELRCGVRVLRCVALRDAYVIMETTRYALSCRMVERGVWNIVD